MPSVVAYAHIAFYINLLWLLLLRRLKNDVRKQRKMDGQRRKPCGVARVGVTSWQAV